MNTVSIDFDNWFTTSPTAAPAHVKEPTYVTFEIDPLVYILKWISEGRFYSEMHEHLQFGQNLDFIKEDEKAVLQKQADDIRAFFKGTILLRRLKNEHISSFMVALEQLNDEVHRVNVEHIRILLKLPDFYKESMETKELFAQYTSLKDLRQPTDICEAWNFVQKIKRSSKNENLWRYYFSNSKNELLSLTTKSNSDTEKFLNYICAEGAIGFKGTAWAAKQPGHDFYFYRLTNFVLYSVTDTTN